MKRIDALKQSAAEQGSSVSFIIFNPNNLTYFTGFSGANALLIPDDGDNVLFVSAVNYEQAKKEARGLNVELLRRGENLMEKIAKQNPVKKFAVDSLPIESWRILAKAVGGQEKLKLANGLILKLRSVKDEQEIQLIREACKFASVGMKVASETIRPGIKERDLAAEVEYAMRKKGSDGTSFDTIIASGPHSAFPHGSCSSRTIRKGELVVVDLGATCNFYRSDMTRTFTAGTPDEKQRKIYETVKQAHHKAFETIRPEAPAAEVDATARRQIEEAGFGEFFVHNLGHGVGLEIHEAPLLGPDSKEILAAGNVVTDEPGIYLPGYGGVRIEDTVLVSQAGAQKLTVGPYSLACES
ncbi:MAG TPA: Xaa-Pro peptidase family protein [Candidatus Limnocylindrales bacterium]|nr:Xaa-Pro peptidase family protein [Candidatus Limnocylindrales bacterium]